MAIWMEQPEIRTYVRASIDAADKVMHMPARDCCNTFSADGTLTQLPAPQVTQLALSRQILLHLQSRTTFEIFFEAQVIGVCSTLNFDVPHNGDVRRISQFH